MALTRAALVSALAVVGALFAASARSGQTEPARSGASEIPAPAPHTTVGSAAAGPFCPLSQAETRRAIAAFRPIAKVFTTEPRCANCHGGIDPFAANANETHAGGQFKPVMDSGKANSTDPGDVDVKATFQPCQGCHSGLPGWREAPRALFFTGKDAPALCAQQKLRFSDPSQFLGHMHNDNGGVQFIATAFAGTRGLNAFAKGLLAKAGKPYHPAPPGIPKSVLTQEANAWVEALGARFVGGPSCGCKPIRYALRLRIKEKFPIIQHGAVRGNFDAEQTGDIPITIGDSGAISGSVRLTRAIAPMHVTLTGIVCHAPAASQSVTWTVSGKLDDPDHPTTITTALRWTGGPVTINASCVSEGRTVPVDIPFPARDSRIKSSPLDDIEFRAEVGDQRKASWTWTQPHYHADVTFELVQVE